MHHVARHVAIMGILQGLFAGIPALSLLLAAVAGASEAQTIRLDLNVPAYRLSVLRGDTVVRMFRVAVGMRAFPTPVGTLEISDVTWNPWWHPPRSAWAQKDSILPPGPENPMGAVKLFIGGLYYLHGTPVDGGVGHCSKIIRSVGQLWASQAAFRDVPDVGHSSQVIF